MGPDLSFVQTKFWTDGGSDAIARYANFCTNFLISNQSELLFTSLSELAWPSLSDTIWFPTTSHTQSTIEYYTSSRASQCTTNLDRFLFELIPNSFIIIFHGEAAHRDINPQGWKKSDCIRQIPERINANIWRSDVRINRTNRIDWTDRHTDVCDLRPTMKFYYISR